MSEQPESPYLTAIAVRIGHLRGMSEDPAVLEIADILQLMTDWFISLEAEIDGE